MHLIEFDDSSDEVYFHLTPPLPFLSAALHLHSQVVCQRVYSHKAQVLDIVASPTSTQQFVSAHTGDDGGAGCTLWSMQDLHSAVVMTLTSPLQQLATFPDAISGNCAQLQRSLPISPCAACHPPPPLPPSPPLLTQAFRCYSADFKRSHQDYIYCAGLSGVSAHAIESGGTREASKGDACSSASPPTLTNSSQSFNEERAHLRARRCRRAARGRGVCTALTHISSRRRRVT